MLRKLLLSFGALLLAGGILALIAGLSQGLPVLGFGALLVLTTVFERWRYKPTQKTAKGQATGERFVDPVTGETVEVYYDAVNGERSYVKADKLKD